MVQVLNSHFDDVPVASEAKEMGMKTLESLIDAINIQLEAGNWSDVVLLSAELYEVLMALGDTSFAELVQDLHWIANDALVHPTLVMAVVQA